MGKYNHIILKVSFTLTFPDQEIDDQVKSWATTHFSKESVMSELLVFVDYIQQYSVIWEGNTAKFSFVTEGYMNDYLDYTFPWSHMCDTIKGWYEANTNVVKLKDHLGHETEYRYEFEDLVVEDL